MRKIVQVCGEQTLYALADDGSLWIFDDSGQGCWEEVKRLPQDDDEQGLRASSIAPLDPDSLFERFAKDIRGKAQSYEVPIDVTFDGTSGDPWAPLQRLFVEVAKERFFQKEKWPDCERLPDGTGGAGRPTYMEIAKNACDRAHREGHLTHAHVFEEESAEVLAEEDPQKLRKELVQVVAVCAKWIADIDSRGTGKVGG